MTAPLAAPATTDRELLVAVRRWARSAGWWLGWSGWHSHDGAIVVDWTEGRDEITVRRKGSTLGRDYPVASVRQAVDILCALDVLPPHLSSAYRAALAERTADLPETDDADPVEIEKLLAEVRSLLASATSDDERAEAIELLLDGWYSAWPDTALGDADAPLAAELVRLLAPWAAQVQQLQGPLAGYTMVTVDAPSLPERSAVPGEPLPPLPDSAYPPGATPLDPADREDLARELIADLRQPVDDTTPAQIVPHGPVRPPYGSQARAGWPAPFADEVPPNAGSAT